MTERLANEIATSLSAAVNAAQTSITVTSATGFPAANFRIRIDNELMLVTGVAGTTWTVTRAVESTTAASHAILADVSHILTAGGLQQAISEAGGNPVNLVVNGSMEVDQRVGPYTTTGSRNNDGSYTLDRWVVLSDGNNIVNVEQETSAANLPTGSRAALKATVVTANKKFGFVTHLERSVARKIIAGSAGLQYSVRTVAANPVSACREGILSWTGTSDAPTKDVVSGSSWNASFSNPTFATNWTLENNPGHRGLLDAWQTIVVDPAAIDTAGTNNVAVFIWVDDTDCAVGDIFYLTDVRLVPGTVALPMIYRDPTIEKLLARRYCVQYTAPSASAMVFGYGQAISGTQLRGSIVVPVTLRATPTLSVSAVGDFGTTTNAFGVATVSAISLYAWFDDKPVITTTSGSLTAGDISMFLTQTSGAWIRFDSEIGV